MSWLTNVIRQRGRAAIVAWAALATAAASIGCQPSISEGGFDSPNPAAKLYAIQRAGEQRDADAVPELISQLDSDDPAVRMYAIIALEKITGERKGYSPYDPPHQRMQAVERWAEAYAAEEKAPDQPDPAASTQAKGADTP